MKTNGRDRAAERDQYLSILARQLPSARLSQILASPDPGRLIRAMPALSLYYDLIEVGLAEAGEVVRFATPEQFRTFVDLGGWARNQLSLEETVKWIRAARGTDLDEFLAKIHALDTEVLELLLRRGIIVHSLEEDPDVNPAGVVMEMPEGKYLIEFPLQGEELGALRSLVSDLVSENPFEAVRFFEALRWELPSELEETALQFRRGRLEDLGFPPLEEAVALFSFLNPDPEAPATQPAAAQIQPVGDTPDYWQLAYQSLEDEEREAAQQELRYLANSALVAEGAEPGDPASIRRGTEMARDYLQLGLEFATGGDPKRGAQLIQERPLRRIFQTGFSLALRVKFRAERLLKHPLARVDDGYLLFPPEAAWVDAVRLTRPRRPARVEGADPVPFRSRHEIAEAEAALGRAEQQVAIFQSLLGGTGEGARRALQRFAAPLSEIGAELLFRAIVAHALLDGRVEAKPVPRARLVQLCERLFEIKDGSVVVRQSAKSTVLSILAATIPDPARPELARLVELTAEALLVELGGAYLAGDFSSPQLGAVLPISGR